MTARPRAVVCGTTFGRVYLAALRSPGSPFELAAVLARGSDRSRACAAEYGVPLCTDLDQLPADIDVACVVVRAGVVGGRGSELVQSLLARGIHVLQEQPVHPDELAACLRAAHTVGVQYQLNPFYAHLEPVRRFLDAAQALLRLRAPAFIDAVCAIQVAYPLLDILARALSGARPWQFTAGTSTSGPYHAVTGKIAGVPLTLRVQNELDPADPDNHAHLLYRVAIGTESGVLTLADPHGPLLWSRRLHVGPGGVPETDEPSVTALGPVPVPSYRDIVHRMWPAAVAHALAELGAAITTNDDPLRRGQFDLAVSRAWRDVTTALGPPRLIRAGAPRPLPVEDLIRAIREEI